ncbi:MAG: DUF2384 domain-containing protein [Ramlibacter sp.]|nr:DUF2384 domain-containing protein [Ramlibacter sp.]
MTAKAVPTTPQAKARTQAVEPVKVVRGLLQEGAVKPREGIGNYSFVEVFRAEPLARVRLIKAGLPADFLDRLSRQMNMPKERLLPALGIAQATVSRKVRESKPLSSDDSERALGMARLVGQVEAMVQESGEPEGFNAAEWVAQWLEEPLAALGGQRPADLMDTAEGQAIVSNMLARMQSGAYA